MPRRAGKGDPLKVAYLVTQYPRVSHSFIRREILALERQGFEVLRLALRGWDDDALPDQEDRRERERTRYVLREGPWALVAPVLARLLRSPVRFFSALRLAIRMAHDSDRPLLYHLVWLAEACRILPWLAEFGAAHLHAHFGWNSAEVAMLARVLGGPSYSFTVHGPREFERPIGLDEKVSRAAFVVAVSSFGRSQLYLKCRECDWSKVKVIHCALERSFYQGERRPIPAEPRLVCVGRLCADKAQVLLIEAAAWLASRGIAFELVLAGDGPARAEIEDAISRCRLHEQVRITGWIGSSEVREQILDARALVLPSFAEGLPVVIMEAMALRRPVLTTYVAGIPELVRHGENGWLFPAGSVEALARAMEDCLTSLPERLEQLGEQAHRDVLVGHSIDAEVSKLARLFRREGSELSRPVESLDTPLMPRVPGAQIHANDLRRRGSRSRSHT
jgi:colanic acid/amylovoran biosynthesis glycosyltransferase